MEHDFLSQRLMQTFRFLSTIVEPRRWAHGHLASGTGWWYREGQYGGRWEFRERECHISAVSLSPILSGVPRKYWLLDGSSHL